MVLVLDLDAPDRRHRARGRHDQSSGGLGETVC